MLFTSKITETFCSLDDFCIALSSIETANKRNNVLYIG